MFESKAIPKTIKYFRSVNKSSGSQSEIHFYLIFVLRKKAFLVLYYSFYMQMTFPVATFAGKIFIYAEDIMVPVSDNLYVYIWIVKYKGNY